MNIRTAQFVSDENANKSLYGQLCSKHRRLQDFEVLLGF